MGAPRGSSKRPLQAAPVIEGRTMIRDAEMSQDGRYRFTLTRCWTAPGEVVNAVAFVVLNPSTADAAKDDPTIRRCMGFAKDNGFNCLWVLSIFPFRASTPSALWASGLEPAGVREMNDISIAAVASQAPAAVFAWGNLRSPEPRKDPANLRGVRIEGRGGVHPRTDARKAAQAPSRRAKEDAVDALSRSPLAIVLFKRMHCPQAGCLAH